MEQQWSQNPMAKKTNDIKEGSGKRVKWSRSGEKLLLASFQWEMAVWSEVSR